MTKAILAPTIRGPTHLITDLLALPEGGGAYFLLKRRLLAAQAYPTSLPGAIEGFLAGFVHKHLNRGPFLRKRQWDKLSPAGRPRR